MCDTKGLCDTATVSIDIVPNRPGNNPPIAVDDASTTTINVPVNGTVAKNDSDPEGTPLTFTRLTTPANGVVVFNPNGTFRYTPNTNYLGPDSFVYVVCDSGSPSLCDTATVHLTVLASPPIATNDINNTRVNSPVSGDVSTNDSDPQGFPLTFTQLGNPANGTLAFNPTTGVYTYTPANGFTGTDTFRYLACSPLNLCDTARVTIKVIPKIDVNSVIANNDATQTPENTPVKIVVLANDVDPQGDALTAPTLIPGSGPLAGTGSVVYNSSDSTFTYTPATGFKGTANFRYGLCDANGACDTAMVTIDIVPNRPGNNPPIAVDDASTTTINVPVSGTVAKNDRDPDNNPLTFTKLTDPANGVVTFNSNGTYTYNPTTDYIGPDRFVYTVCDNGSPGLCDTATVYVTILINDIFVQPRVYLQGALFGVTYTDAPANTIVDSLMRDDLRVKGLLPLNAPVNKAPAAWGAGPDSMAGPGVLTVTGRNAIVDWVFVELRDPNDSTVVVAKRWGLVQRDGDVVDMDGVSLLRFRGVAPAAYYITVRHRNHLGVMSAEPIVFKLFNNIVDFRLPGTPTYRRNASPVNVSQATVVQGKALWSGNALQDEVVVYQGTGNDITIQLLEVISAIGNPFANPNFILSTYSNGDLNMDGRTIYQGTSNDPVFIYQNIISHPGNVFDDNFFVITGQIPKPR